MPRPLLLALSVAAVVLAVAPDWASARQRGEHQVRFDATFPSGNDAGYGHTWVGLSYKADGPIIGYLFHDKFSGPQRTDRMDITGFIKHRGPRKMPVGSVHAYGFARGAFQGCAWAYGTHKFAYRRRGTTSRCDDVPSRAEYKSLQDEILCTDRGDPLCQDGVQDGQQEDKYAESSHVPTGAGVMFPLMPAITVGENCKSYANVGAKAFTRKGPSPTRPQDVLGEVAAGANVLVRYTTKDRRFVLVNPTPPDSAGGPNIKFPRGIDWAFVPRECVTEKDQPQARRPSDAIDTSGPAAPAPAPAPAPTAPGGPVGARQVAVGQTGRMMLIDGCGGAWSKDDPTAAWTRQTGCDNARQVAVGGNGRMMLISGCGAAFSKDNTYDSFVEQTGCGNARQVAVGGNGRMMLISGCGAAFSKDNTYDSFVEQTGCGNAQHVAVGGNGRMMLISGCGAAFSKDNTYDSFVEQTGCGNAQQVSVGDPGRMMLISGCGGAFSKDNTYDAFVEQTGCGNARQVAVGGRNRIMLISGCGAAFSKDNTYDSFVEQTGCGNARQVAVGGAGRMMLISGCGAAFSKDNTYDTWREQVPCG